MAESDRIAAAQAECEWRVNVAAANAESDRRRALERFVRASDAIRNHQTGTERGKLAKLRSEYDKARESLFGK